MQQHRYTDVIVGLNHYQWLVNESSHEKACPYIACQQQLKEVEGGSRNKNRMIAASIPEDGLENIYHPLAQELDSDLVSQGQDGT